jgi:hypothetical protein
MTRGPYLRAVRRTIGISFTQRFTSVDADGDLAMRLGGISFAPLIGAAAGFLVRSVSVYL